MEKIFTNRAFTLNYKSSNYFEKKIITRLKFKNLFKHRHFNQPFIILPLLTIFLSGCNNSQRLTFYKAQQASLNKEYRTAVSLFENIILREKENSLSIKAARELVKIYLFEIKDYEKAISKLKFLILYSRDEEERIKSQKQLATIYFDNLAEYEKAVVEFSKLLLLSITNDEKIETRLSIARAYYHMGNFEQSWIESQSLMEITNIPKDKLYDILLLQANIKMGRKDHLFASKLYEQLITQFPTRSAKENIPLNLSLCYEVQEDFMKAISILEPFKKYYHAKEFIDYKISKLKERQNNKPKKRIKK